METNDNVYIPLSEYPYYIVPFTSDYGFKVAFTEDSLFMRKAIQLMIGSDVPIDKLTMERNELSGFTIDGRAGLYDALCRDEHKRIFILEMQVDNYKHFVERLLYYSFHQYCTMVTRGKHGFKDLHPIHCICIVEDKITPFDNYYNQIRLLNEFGQLFSELVLFHVIELGKFPIKKNEFSKIITDMDELVYTLKHAHNIDPNNQSEMPNFWNDDWLGDVLHKLDISRMSPQQRAMLDMSIVRHNLYFDKQKMEHEELLNIGREEGREEGIQVGMEKGKQVGREEGIQEGIQVGREEGIQEGREVVKQDIAKKMFEQGFAVEQIAQIIGISIEKIHQSINENK